LDEATAERIKRGLTSGPGAEQDRYASHWSLPEGATARLTKRLSRQDPGPGAEQDRYGSRFGLSNETIQGAKEGAAIRANSGLASGGEQDRLGSHFGLRPTNPMGPGSVGVVGILQSTVLPTFAINSGLGLIAYAGSRYTDRLDLKDTIRPLAPVVNAWWMAVGRRMYYFGIPFSVAWDQMSYSEKLVLGGLTVQGLKIAYLQATRSIARGEDEPRYQAAKKEPSFWDKAALNTFLPEAAFQTLIALPFTLAFRLGPSVALTPAPAFAELAHNIAIFLFGSGFALQTVSDYQLAKHNTVKPERLHRRGPWSIVRHPK
jgi:steroid 5-alpha reductase family enzyme